MKLSYILKDSAYKLSQFDGSKIEALEQLIVEKEVRGKATPYITCAVRNKEIKLISLALLI